MTSPLPATTAVFPVPKRDCEACKGSGMVTYEEKIIGADSTRMVDAPCECLVYVSMTGH